MAGLLTRALAGGLRGIGDGMVEKAKQDREDKLLAIARTQHTEDRDAGFQQQDLITDKNEAGATARSDAGNATSITTTSMNNDTQRADTASNNATSIRTTGMNDATSAANNAATITGENSRQGAAFVHADIQPTLTGKLTPLEANTIATKQWAAYSGGVDGKEGDLPVKNLDGSPAEKGAWIASYRDRLMRGGGKLAPLNSSGPPPIVAAQRQNGPVLSSASSSPGATGIGAQAGGGLTSNLFGGPPAPLGPQITPPLGAVDMLRKNPAMRDAFDHKYGQGAAARTLGQ